uniref:Uncharacterized protein n=1 Tax=Arundo donax TaxID=35708 RepID=A0A0A9C199_ARUDO
MEQSRTLEVTPPRLLPGLHSPSGQG